MGCLNLAYELGRPCTISVLGRGRASLLTNFGARRAQPFDAPRAELVPVDLLVTRAVEFHRRQRLSQTRCLEFSAPLCRKRPFKRPKNGADVSKCIVWLRVTSSDNQ
jgi:hypothetical protein